MTTAFQLPSFENISHLDCRFVDIQLLSQFAPFWSGNVIFFEVFFLQASDLLFRESCAISATHYVTFDNIGLLLAFVGSLIARFRRRRWRMSHSKFWELKFNNIKFGLNAIETVKKLHTLITFRCRRSSNISRIKLRRY
jgi:hypothetical protein